MIQLTKLNMQEFMVNSDLIEVIEQNPDTVITMSTGKKFVIRESKEEVVIKITNYKRKIITPLE